MRYKSLSIKTSDKYSSVKIWLTCIQTWYLQNILNLSITCNQSFVPEFIEAVFMQMHASNRVLKTPHFQLIFLQVCSEDVTIQSDKLIKIKWFSIFENVFLNKTQVTYLQKNCRKSLMCITSGLFVLSITYHDSQCSCETVFFCKITFFPLNFMRV